MIFWQSKVQPPVEEVPMETPKKKSYLKPIALSLGVAFGVAHIGVLGHLINATRPEFPVINFPTGDYASYRMTADKNGYSIEYRANDPTVMNSNRAVQRNTAKKGLFGGDNIESYREVRRDEYTMDGVRNIGGSISDAEGKSLAKTEECIRADAGARSQGAMAGTAISAGVVVPAVASIPYVGWLASGWALLLGQRAGSEIGAEVGSAFNDC